MARSMVPVLASATSSILHTAPFRHPLRARIRARVERLSRRPREPVRRRRRGPVCAIVTMVAAAGISVPRPRECRACDARSLMARALLCDRFRGGRDQRARAAHLHASWTTSVLVAASRICRMIGTIAQRLRRGDLSCGTRPTSTAAFRQRRSRKRCASRPTPSFPRLRPWADGPRKAARGARHALVCCSRRLPSVEPARLSDEEIVYETFHSTFVGLGGFRCSAASSGGDGGRRRRGDGGPLLLRLRLPAVRATIKRTRPSAARAFRRARRRDRRGRAGEPVRRDPPTRASGWTRERPLSGPWEGRLKYGFCAHGAGERLGPCSRRRCPGEELSTLAIKLICVEVLGRYELQLVEGQDLSECNDTALPVPTSGLRVRLRARE